MTTQLRLGVDIGRVIIDGSSHPSGDDTAFFKGGLDNALRTPPMAGVFGVLPRLVDLFEHRVWLVSKCGDRVQQRTLAWLEHHDFYERTGITPTSVRFCRTRPEKADHAAELRLTDFIDDRADVHEALKGIVERCYLFGPQRRAAAGWMIATPTWTAVEAEIDEQLAHATATPPDGARLSHWSIDDSEHGDSVPLDEPRHSMPSTREATRQR